MKLTTLTICLSLFSAFTFISCSDHSTTVTKPVIDTAPSIIKGNFTDDYGIKYFVSDTVWAQLPGIKYHILKWNIKEQYCIARNDEKNPSEPGLYTRIDYMMFNNMEPFLWGFCLSVYNAPNDSVAENTYKADRANPKKGCNGFPFSRMKRY